MSIKKGFTITEIMVAMSIIGVLAAIMIPTFYRSKPNQEMLMLKKSYFMMSRAISEIMNDEHFYPDDDDGLNDTAEVQYHGDRFRGDAKFCNLVAERMNILGDKHCAAGRTFENGGSFTTQDGAIWILPIASDFSRGQTIQVDVNGAKGKNCAPSINCNDKPDRFSFTVDRFGRITIPPEARGYLSSTNSVATYRQIMNQ